MRIFVLLVFLFGLHQIEAENYASKGALTEAMVILQNKQRDVADYIKSLKKELTDCYRKESAASHKKKHERALIKYHCKLKSALYPHYIEELENLLKINAKCIDDLQKIEQHKQETLKHTLDYAFLLKDKIDNESKYISLVFSVDLAESEREHINDILKRKVTMLSSGKISQKRINAIQRNIKSLEQRNDFLRRSVAENKRTIKELRAELVRINNLLYAQPSDFDKLYLDRLTFYK